jgi:hypothetical protein
MSQQHNDLPASKKLQVQLALQANGRDATLSQQRAAVTYNISQSSLSTRRAGTTLCRNCTPNSLNLVTTETEMIFQHIIDLDVRGFAPRLAAVKDMTDSLLVEGHCNPVGQKWAANFVKRQSELKVKFNLKVRL